MDWTGLNQINTILGIINGVVGIINIGTAFWGWLNHKNKKQFMEKLEKERISALRCLQKPGKNECLTWGLRRRIWIRSERYSTAARMPPMPICR